MSTVTNTHTEAQDDTRPNARVNACSTLDLLDRSRDSLLEACHASDVSERYLQAQLAALRAGAALVATRSAPSGGGPRSLWELVPAVAPELSEWASFFAHSTARRSQIATGRVEVAPREADDLLRQAETFIEVVGRLLGIPGPHPGHRSLLTPLTRASTGPE